MTRTRGTLAGIVAAAVAVAVGGFGAQAAQAALAEGQIVRPARNKVVKDQYIVTLRKDAGLTARAAGGTVAQRYGGRVLWTYYFVLPGVDGTGEDYPGRSLLGLRVTRR
ncbi:hypothetical protein [Actinoplanes sp. TFC3]|uniref:hypothetical protein n=1 Tax=Actinoplanes sp. TFC3 TaxID=1710355 RepID=UPI00082A2529|nr:hypothetical protein [Actinoplanes sp. TFC3]